jgi:hypothetical protein
MFEIAKSCGKPVAVNNIKKPSFPDGFGDIGPVRNQTN